MNPFVPHIFPYLGGLLVLSISAFCIGWFVSCFIPEFNKKTNPSVRFSSALMIGLTIVIPIFAVIWTRGNTILILALILWLVYFIYYYCSKKIVRISIKLGKEDLKSIWGFITIMLLSFFGFYWLFFVRSGGQLFSDQLYYGNLSYWLLSSHSESARILFQSSSATMYHWGDIWATVLVSAICHLKPIYALCLISYPFFAAIGIWLFVTIVKSFLPNIPYLFAFLLAVCVLFYKPFISIFLSWDSPLFEGPKSFLIACFMLWGCSLYLSNIKQLAALALLLLVPFYSVISPGVLSLTFFLGIYFSCKNTWIRRALNPISIMAVVVAFLFLLFYLIQPADSSSSMAPLYDGNFFVNALLFGCKRSARLIVTLLPIIIALVIVNLIKPNPRINHFFHIGVCIILSCVVSAFIGGLAKQFMLDGGQITTNFCGIVAIILEFVGILLCMSSFSVKSSWMINGISILFVSFPVFYWLNERHPSYPKSSFDQTAFDCYQALKAELEDTDSFVCGYYRNYLMDGNLNTQMTRIDMFFPMDKLVHVVPNGFYCPYCLSVLDRPTNIDPIWDDTGKSHLYQYKSHLLQAGDSLSNDEYAQRFVHSHNINYIVIENGAQVPKYLSDVTLITTYAGDSLFHINQ